MDMIRWFDALGKDDVHLAGGKGANLGELARAGLPVPPGFVLTTHAFRQFLSAHRQAEEIRRRVDSLDVNDTAYLRQTSVELQRRVLDLEIPVEIAEEIRQAYSTLGRSGESAAFVAIRSSATAEDSPETSFAGMNETFLNVRGADDVLDAVRQCYASLYSERVLFYRHTEGVPEEKMAIAVIVQRMVNSEAAGVMFTVDPTTGDRAVVVIEGAFGLGDAVVSGSVNPDHFAVRKDTHEIISRQTAHKDFRNIRLPDGTTVQEPLAMPRAEQPSLTDEQVQELAAMGARIEEHYGSPQDIEWALERGTLYIVQSRAVTATGHAAPSEQADGEVLIRGLAASPGIASGRVRVLASPQQEMDVRQGDILVTRMTSPDWAPIMKRAAAIVTDEGGATTHAAIVSRELGIPCIVGTSTATEVLQTGQLVTVDATAGVVYAGKREQPAAAPIPAAGPAAIITGTRLYVNLAQPEMAEDVAARNVDGVGLLRAEFIMQAITEGIHPRQLMDGGRSDELRDKLAANLLRFARAFTPRPVIYRSLDFRSNEYRGMQGGEKYERTEANPMIGYRGCFRNVAEADLFGIELAAITRVWESGLTNLHLMIPFVRTPKEFAQCAALVRASGLTDRRDFELWVMAEVPSIIYHLEDYAKQGVSGISIGSNDLTQLMLGIDRDSEVLAPLFDERDPAVLGAMRQIITGCRKLGLTSSICGQAPSVYPDLCELLVRWGITSISVNPDALARTRRYIAAAEQRVLLEKATQETWSSC